MAKGTDKTAGSTVTATGTKGGKAAGGKPGAAAGGKIGQATVPAGGKKK